MSDQEETKKELRRLVESGGEDALLPRVLLDMMQAQENSAAADKTLASQIAELQESTQRGFKQADKDADSSRKESATAEEKTAAALARLDKKASWGVGLAIAVLVVALAIVALIAWKNFT